jgi:hypothetical protein
MLHRTYRSAPCRRAESVVVIEEVAQKPHIAPR